MISIEIEEIFDIELLIEEELLDWVIDRLEG